MDNLKVLGLRLRISFLLLVVSLVRYYTASLLRIPILMLSRSTTFIASHYV
jgi:hypothetical protein